MIQNKFLLKNKKSSRFVIGSILGLTAILVLMASDRLLYFWSAQNALGQSEAIIAGLQAENQRLLVSSREIAESGVLNRYIKDRNLIDLFAILTDEKARRGVGDMVVTDAEGIVLSRTQVPARRGDFVFETTDWGKALAAGETVSAVMEGRAWPLVLMGGTRIEENGKLVGTILSSEIVTDGLVRNLANKYLINQAQVALYARKSGVVGSSFEPESQARLVTAYFNVGSDWTENLETDQSVEKEGQNYFVFNVT